MKQIIAAILIFLMSNIVSAEVINNLPHDTRNLPPDDSYAFFDFEEGTGHFDSLSISQYNDTIEFINVFVDNRDQIWSYNDAKYPLMHVYPQNVFFQDDQITPVNFTYLINGRYAASTVVELYIGGFYVGTFGLINLPEGANHVSFLVSTGNAFTMSVFDWKGNLIDKVVVKRNINRVSLPNGPSTWSLVSFDTTNSEIYSVVFTATCNDWLIDDLVIGGLTLPERPTNYTYAAERMKKMVGAEYIPYGTAWDYVLEEYRTAEEMLDNIPDPYFNFDYKPPELEFGIGINDQDAILYAFNGDGEEVVNWWDINKMAKADFTEVVEYGNQKPGDVFFIDYPQDLPDGSYGPDGCYDEIGIVIEPTVDTTGDIVDIIRIIPDAGVHYSTSGFINALYANSGIVDYRSLPDNPKGGHSPYKKISSKLLI